MHKKYRSNYLRYLPTAESNSATICIFSIARSLRQFFWRPFSARIKAIIKRQKDSQKGRNLPNWSPKELAKQGKKGNGDYEYGRNTRIGNY